MILAISDRVKLPYLDQAKSPKVLGRAEFSSRMKVEEKDDCK